VKFVNTTGALTRVNSSEDGVKMLESLFAPRATKEEEIVSDTASVLDEEMSESGAIEEIEDDQSLGEVEGEVEAEAEADADADADKKD